ncbi:hypothetical protein [Paenibacillus ehimensis]|uniref:Transposase n=1 Tax=Paenibacillus ehimensis TaxID=79264 RepID=A0ABT8VEN7_9BACL|nr:hypothetical protein [Paenibacillus ehimensis]MDO3679408.1 hypothetical protein [Paenibacillus ehimensis]MEC0207943.1 hypothetical protein [Paenibacillus ehimensis]
MVVAEGKRIKQLDIEKEKQAYLDGQKTVKELRKELDLPANNLK